MKTNTLISPLVEKFPFCTEKGSDHLSINSQKMRLLAEFGHKLTEGSFQKIQEVHHEFLSAGGAGGKWQILQVGDLVVGFYDVESKAEGQAVFERMNLTKVKIKDIELPFANFCGAFAIKTDFSFSNLSYSLFTDASLESTNFEGAYLKNVDFSRSNLMGACFKNADLSGVDFENCNLSNADFRGAKIKSARFPGAILDEIQY